MPAVSIIIRTKNEEQWIGRCLEMVFRQEYRDFEVILVDNQSRDHTLEIAGRFPIQPPVAVTEYRPGRALNEGIRRSGGRFVVCLSAHCIPQNERWLGTLVGDLDEDPGPTGGHLPTAQVRGAGAGLVAGVYGRQLPLPFSEPSDKRDLLITFGLDRRVQVKDYFFHNANSLIRRAVWEQIPFDEQVTNVEDRLWAKAAIEAGYRLVYEPEAAVYHHHGIHQNEDRQRARSVVSVMEQFEGDAAWQDLPEFLRPENYNVAAILPVRGEVKHVAGRDLLARLIEQMGSARYPKSVHVLAESEAAEQIARDGGAHFLPRPPEMLSADKGLEDVLQYALAQIELSGNYPEALLYANYLYPFRPPRLFDELIADLCYKGLDTVFPGQSDYFNFWAHSPEGGFVPIGDSLKLRERKQPVFRSLYGLGSVASAPVIRAGKLVGERVGILPIEDPLFALKCADPRSDQLAALVLQSTGTAG